MVARVSDWPRIMRSQYRATPVGAGFGSSRFSSPTQSFKVLYAASDFGTAFAEGVVRDRFESKTRRYLYRPDLDRLCVTAVHSNREMSFVDLTGGGAYELGVDTDASRARDHRSGQDFSEQLHAEMLDVDGILFDSRLTGGRCIAVYDRALSDFSAPPPIALVQAAQLAVEIKRLGIIVRRKRGY